VPRRGVVLVGVLLLLVVVPSASAWTKLSPGGLENSVDPSPLVLVNGKTLVAYRVPKAHSIVVSVDGKTKTIAGGLAAVGDPRLVQLPSGTLVLFAADQSGVVSFTSSNGGESWSGPGKTGSSNTGNVQAAAVRKDGTPLFSQDGTGFVNVFQGAAGESSHNLFTTCCGYGESLAVDSHGLAQVAFWSNASGHGGYLYGKLSAGGALAGGLRTLSSGETVERADPVPLAADDRGNTFVSFANGYPTATALVVATLRGGATAHKVTLATGHFSGNEPLLALDVDKSGRLWAVWTHGGALWGARSRSHGAHFGAAVHVALPGSGYDLEAAATPDGSVTAIVNDGSALRSQQLLPGLTVQASSQGVRVLDDGFPVPGATVHAGGKTAKTDASGSANFGVLAHHTTVSVSAAGYTPASATTP
jgi:hypothetical protein